MKLHFKTSIPKLITHYWQKISLKFITKRNLEYLNVQKYLAPWKFWLMSEKVFGIVALETDIGFALEIDGDTTKFAL